jgi:uncharacterized repeat protein (TIGR03803 family)
MKTNGEAFTVLHTFSDYTESYPANQDGMYPEGLLLSDRVLYSVTSNGGTNGIGVVYSINSDGSDFTVLYTFSEISVQTHGTNFDGAYPEGALVLSGSTLYGTTEQGGTGNGTVFSLKILPRIASLRLSGKDLILEGRNGVAGENCVVLTSGDLTLPLNQWTPVSSNILATSGRFTLTATNAADLAAPQRFYALRVQ